MRTTFFAMLAMMIVWPSTALVPLIILGNLLTIISAAWPWLLGVLLMAVLAAYISIREMFAQGEVYRLAFEEEQLRRADIWARTRVTRLLDPAFIPGRSLVARGSVTHRRRAPMAALPEPLSTSDITAQHAPLPTGGPYAQQLRAAKPRLR